MRLVSVESGGYFLPTLRLGKYSLVLSSNLGNNYTDQCSFGGIVQSIM